MRWLLLVLLVVNFAVFPRAFDEPVRLATHNLAPYGSFQSNSQHEYLATDQFQGYAIDVVRCSFNRMNQNLEVYVMPWTRAQEAVKTDQMHGFFAASQQKERDQYAIMSDIIAEQKWVWYYLKSNSLSPSHPKFKQQAQVASFNGANMQTWLNANGFNVSANPNNTSRLHEMLVLGRLDAVLANNLVMADIIREKNTGDKIASTVLRNKPLGIYFSKRFIKQTPDFLRVFNRAIKTCRKSLP